MRRSSTNFFQGLGKNTCSLQPALKNTTPGLGFVLWSLKKIDVSFLKNNVTEPLG